MLQLLRFHAKIGRQLIRPDGVYLECAVIACCFCFYFHSRFSAFSQPQGEESRRECDKSVLLQPCKLAGLRAGHQP